MQIEIGVIGVLLNPNRRGINLQREPNPPRCYWSRPMRYVVALLLCPTLLLGDEAKPNTLTQKEIEEGWILLFDGGTTFGWKTEGEAKIKDGQLLLGDPKNAASLAQTSLFRSFEFRFEYIRQGKISVTTSGGTDSAHFNNFDGSDKLWRKATIKVKLGERAFGNQLWSKSLALESSTRGETWDYPILAQPVKPTAVQFSVPRGSQLALRSIKLRPLDTLSLFNGKDLAGWKVFDDPKRNASKWSVTKEGWLNVKNGPGDLQTEKKFDDFILQFDCISNGKALNSGVFFRCIENQYQNGYEAQVQNGFKDNDRTKPADFGTGAIYRRVAARKVVPNDNEWFTMTVLAHGKHFATWVNGYQTVDWTDDRKENDNPRNGYRAAAGHISIQGHDPTTDLSFRNIRIVELKSK
jgi:3-keto-disaccharide hydrolase